MSIEGQPSQRTARVKRIGHLRGCKAKDSQKGPGAKLESKAGGNWKEQNEGSHVDHAANDGIIGGKN